MAEFEEKLNSILSNPTAMSQIMSIAKTLSGEGQGPPAQGGPPNSDAAPPAPQAENAAPPPDLSALFSMLGGPGGPDGAQSPLAGLDPKLLQSAIRLFSAYSASDDRKTALLEALRPFLKEERCEKMDKAIQIAKLSRLVRLAFHLFRGGEADV